MFRNRFEAGRMLVTKLRSYASQTPLVIAVNRGGVAVAQPIARFLRGPLDVLLTRPVYADGGLAIGALAVGGGKSFDEVLVRSAGLGPSRLAEQVERARHGLDGPSAALRGDRPFPDVTGKVVIVVSDGLAPIHDVIAVVRSVRSRSPRWLALAAPFFTRETTRRLLAEVDVAVSLTLGEPTGSIYEDLHHTDDEEATILLRQARAAEEEQKGVQQGAETDE